MKRMNFPGRVKGRRERALKDLLDRFDNMTDDQKKEALVKIENLRKKLGV